MNGFDSFASWVRERSCAYERGECEGTDAVVPFPRRFSAMSVSTHDVYLETYACPWCISRTPYYQGTCSPGCSYCQSTTAHVIINVYEHIIERGYPSVCRHTLGLSGLLRGVCDRHEDCRADRSLAIACASEHMTVVVARCAWDGDARAGGERWRSDR